MGLLDRLRGARTERTERAQPAERTEPTAAADGVTAGGAAAGGAGAPRPVPAEVAAPVVRAEWAALPPLLPTSAARPAGVADARFGGRLPTWQDPSFSATASPPSWTDGRPTG